MEYIIVNYDIILLCHIVVWDILDKLWTQMTKKKKKKYFAVSL